MISPMAVFHDFYRRPPCRALHCARSFIPEFHRMGRERYWIAQDTALLRDRRTGVGAGPVDTLRAALPMGAHLGGA